LLFLAGWPACGEAFYGEWLAERYDFRHIDLEAESSRDSKSIDLWKNPKAKHPDALANHLLEMHPRWVLTGRAPTGDLSKLTALKAAGFSLWFLLARREEFSRHRWLLLEREADPVTRTTEWKKQAAAIRGSARNLRPFFRNQCIETLVGADELLDVEEMAVKLGFPAKT
jgi:hypothetical protein